MTNVSFHGMFGLVNLQGVPKPTYRAYQLLHQVGNIRHAVMKTPVGAGNSNGCGESIGALAISDNRYEQSLFPRGGCDLSVECDLCVFALITTATGWCCLGYVHISRDIAIFVPLTQ